MVVIQRLQGDELDNTLVQFVGTPVVRVDQPFVGGAVDDGAVAHDLAEDVLIVEPEVDLAAANALGGVT